MHKIDELSDTFERQQFYPTVVCLTEDWLNGANKSYLNTLSAMSWLHFVAGSGLPGVVLASLRGKVRSTG